MPIGDRQLVIEFAGIGTVAEAGIVGCLMKVLGAYTALGRCRKSFESSRTFHPLV